MTNGKWTVAKLAKALKIDPDVQTVDIVLETLFSLQSSPLLQPGQFPSEDALLTRRHTYRCDTCGANKRSHQCSIDDIARHASKKRKRNTFKPLTLLLQFNHDEDTQYLLSQMEAMDKSKITLHVRKVTNDLGQCHVFVDASWNLLDLLVIMPCLPFLLGDKPQPSFIGQVSELYKSLVSQAIDDGTLIRIKLHAIDFVISNSSSSYYRVQVDMFRDTSWRMKRLCELDFIKISNRQQNSPISSESDGKFPEARSPNQMLSGAYLQSGLPSTAPYTMPLTAGFNNNTGINNAMVNTTGLSVVDPRLSSSSAPTYLSSPLLFNPPPQPSSSSSTTHTLSTSYNSVPLNNTSLSPLSHHASSLSPSPSTPLSSSNGPPASPTSYSPNQSFLSPQSFAQHGNFLPHQSLAQHESPVE